MQQQPAAADGEGQSPRRQGIAQAAAQHQSGAGLGVTAVVAGAHLDRRGQQAAGQRSGVLGGAQQQSQPLPLRGGRHQVGRRLRAHAPQQAVGGGCKLQPAVGGRRQQRAARSEGGHQHTGSGVDLAGTGGVPGQAAERGVAEQAPHRQVFMQRQAQVWVHAKERGLQGAGATRGGVLVGAVCGAVGHGQTGQQAPALVVRRRRWR